MPNGPVPPATLHRDTSHDRCGEARSTRGCRGRQRRVREPSETVRLWPPLTYRSNLISLAMLLLECFTMCGFAFQPEVHWTQGDITTERFFRAWTLELPLAMTLGGGRWTGAGDRSLPLVSSYPMEHGCLVLKFASLNFGLHPPQR